MGSLADVWKWLLPGHFIGEVTADIVIRTGSEKNIILKLGLKLEGKIKILCAKKNLWVDHICTRLVLVQTRPTEKHQQLTCFQSEQKHQSLRHWYYQRIFQSKVEKRTYQGTQIQTYHRHIDHWINLILRGIEIPVNILKRRSIRRKSVRKTGNTTRHTHRQEILIRPTTVTTDASEVKRRSIRKIYPIKLCAYLTVNLMTTEYKLNIIRFKLDEDPLQCRIYFLTFVDSLEMKISQYTETWEITYRLSQKRRGEY